MAVSLPADHSERANPADNSAHRLERDGEAPNMGERSAQEGPGSRTAHTNLFPKTLARDGMITKSEAVSTEYSTRPQTCSKAPLPAMLHNGQPHERPNLPIL